jgi:hypothetical protein
MQCRFSTLKGYAVQAADGELGYVDDFYYDDSSWTVRYLVVDAGSVLTPRKVLLSAQHLGKVDSRERVIHSSLRCDQAITLPNHAVVHEAYRPESLTTELQTGNGATELSGLGFGALVPMATESVARTVASGVTAPASFDELFDKLLTDGKGNGNLRSANAVRCYGVVACDGSIGQVVDFLLDEQKTPWSIRNLLVDTAGWLPGQKILLAPHWIDQVNWEWEQIYVNASRQSLLKDLRLQPCQVPTSAPAVATGFLI